ncbi:CBS domain-containing protein [Croceibacterium sp. LX-88]|jgi:CBS domain-containing protein|uniref:CBS domain-containing protein n=1 Tax=Croceibacterium selenioxidans TaxID=2838833 RepID=A0ABS5W7J0_9SPHN|nr:CBS domain-containing protein [Croceibacterium selenioxidans]MBT2135283.1 CBS domain-containing protein [Croceibacterium selenioxidans]
MTIARVIAGRNQQIIECSPEETVRAAAERLAENRIGAMPVVTGGQVDGIFSERDLLYCIARHGAAALDLKVADVMTAPPIAAEPTTDVLDALEVMTLRRIRHLPVLDGDRLAAFISIGDLVKYRLELVESEANAMRDYIRTA